MLSATRETSFPTFLQAAGIHKIVPKKIRIKFTAIYSHRLMHRTVTLKCGRGLNFSFSVVLPYFCLVCCLLKFTAVSLYGFQFEHNHNNDFYMVKTRMVVAQCRMFPKLFPTSLSRQASLTSQIMSQLYIRRRNQFTVRYD